jgi:hypothetical protein
VIACGVGNLIHPSGRIECRAKAAEPVYIKQGFGEVTKMSRKIEYNTYLSNAEAYGCSVQFLLAAAKIVLRTSYAS